MKFLLAILCLIFSSISIASMCVSILNGLADDPIKAAKDYADVIFQGEAVFTETVVVKMKGSESSIRKVITKFENVQSIKGNVASAIFLEASKSCSCKKVFEVGVKYVVFARRISKEIYSPFDCSYIYTKGYYDEFWKKG